MRDDMSKVVTERPRQGHGNKSNKTTGPRIRRYDPDREYDEPTRLPVARFRQYGYDAKEFSDLINPLKRYLRTCIGNGIEPTRTRAHGRVNREKLAEIDLHWHDLRHEAACRWLTKGLDLRAIQLLLGHADLKTTQRYLNVTDDELRKAMAEKLWNKSAR